MRAKNKAHYNSPANFPLNINNSVIILGCSGDITVTNTPQLNEHESELLSVFRSLTVKQQVLLLENAYEMQSKGIKK